MIYLNAFLLGGILCVLGQLALMYTKLDPPKILICGLTLGAILTPFGMIGQLVEWGGAGMVVMVVGAGEAFYSATTAAIAGNWMPTFILLGIIVVLLLLGIAAGYIYTLIHKDNDELLPGTMVDAEKESKNTSEPSPS